jgi:SagB-type dehydrogenase family enzyme
MTAKRYHDATKHSPVSVRRDAHFLDWANRPRPFKIYTDLEPIPLPRDLPQSGVAALSAVSAIDATGVAAGVGARPDLRALAHALYFAAGITKRRTYPGGELLFRAASCTGALYEIELYVVCGDLADLAAGVYHFNPGDMALRRLRAGDWRAAVEPVPAAPAMVISTGTYWRNAWKYQARTYRHFGWDNGTLLANLLAAAAAQGLPARLWCGFRDSAANALLGLDTAREVALSVVTLGKEESAPPAPGVMPELHLETVPSSREEVDYPLMREMHASTLLETSEEVAAWRGEMRAIAPAPGGDVVPLAPLGDDAMPRDTIEEVILRRGSTRRFRHDPITLVEFSTILDRATRGIPADFRPEAGEGLNEIYVIVNAVEGLRPGAYYYRAAERALEVLKLGDFRRPAAYLGLEQDLPGDAAAAIFFLADLERVLARFGNRGYRAVQLEAGLLGGKMYLASYAQRVGTTGLTFYDDDVTAFFSPHAAGKSAIFLIAVGHAARRTT